MIVGFGRLFLLAIVACDFINQRSKCDEHHDNHDRLIECHVVHTHHLLCVREGGIQFSKEICPPSRFRVGSQAATVMARPLYGRDFTLASLL